MPQMPKINPASLVSLSATSIILADEVSNSYKNASCCATVGILSPGSKSMKFVSQSSWVSKSTMDWASCGLAFLIVNERFIIL
jgi:hypothetical protein